jgi:hypothetical protein
MLNVQDDLPPAAPLPAPALSDGFVDAFRLDFRADIGRSELVENAFDQDGKSFRLLKGNSRPAASSGPVARRLPPSSPALVGAVRGQDDANRRPQRRG